MNINPLHHEFWNILTQVQILAMEKLDPKIGTEEQPLYIGNVQFWYVGNEWCYNLPTGQWNKEAITEDIIFWLSGKAK